MNEAKICRHPNHIQRAARNVCLILALGCLFLAPARLTGQGLHGTVEIASSQGQVTLTWLGSGPYLQSAYQVTGPWFPVPGATSPYTTPATATQQYFRLSFGTLNINDLPIAVNDAYGVPYEQTLTIPAPGVLANDSDRSACR
jgi:hypothetical protein